MEQPVFATIGDAIRRGFRFIKPGMPPHDEAPTLAANSLPDAPQGDMWIELDGAAPVATWARLGGRWIKLAQDESNPDAPTP